MAGSLVRGQAPPLGGGGTNSGNLPLDSWSFRDNTNWTSDTGVAPVSFTNLAFSNLGNGASLVVASTNPAWLQFNAVESNGTTNFSPKVGSVSFWFAPCWSSTNAGGSGPGECGRLFEVGAYTTNSSFGWWSIYVDTGGNNIYFSTQTNDLSGTATIYLCAPISWTTNYFHNVVVTYSQTNTALYLDGALVTNGPPLTVYPGPNALAKGFYIGSDSNGVYQAQGLFNSLVTYNFPLDAETIGETFNSEYDFYMMIPWNRAMFKLSDAKFVPSTNPTPNVVTGQGNMQILGTSPLHLVGTNANNVWLTNITAVAASGSTMNVTFTIEGGMAGCYYDVFVSPALQSPITNGIWTWQGQVQQWQICSLTNLPGTELFFVLGTPVDSDGDGVTDAYEALVSHTNPHVADTDGDGIPDGWSVLLGIDPTSNASAQQSSRLNYSYTPADWLNTIFGVKSGTVITDNEGNVQTVSQ